MLEQKVVFNKNRLVIAVSLAILGGAMSGCGSSSSTSTEASAVPSEAVVFKVLAKGGQGGVGSLSDGGNGGELYVYNDGATGGVEVLQTGAANTDFTSPSALVSETADVGDNPLIISADTTIDTVATNYNQVADAAAVGIGSIYMGTDLVLRTSGGTGFADYLNDAVLADNRFYTANNTNELYQAVGGDAMADLAAAGIIYQKENTPAAELYLSDADVANSDSSFSGISVAEGATLTLADNYSSRSRVRVSNDIDNSGTITRLNDDGNALELYADSYFASGKLINAGNINNIDAGDVRLNMVSGIKNEGLINASGFTDTAGGSGGNGGEIYMNADGYALNNGLLNASGGDGAGTGDGDTVSIYAAYLENNGEINVSGGSDSRDAATAAGGGSAGSVSLSSDYVTNNTANIDASGGNGSAGGSGGSVRLENDDIGEVKNAGGINVSGGAGISGDGGNGGSFNLYGDNGHALSSADVDATGGDTSDVNSDGGQGGSIYVSASYRNYNQPIGDAVVSGNLDVSGGNAVAAGEGNGGDAGDITIENQMPNSSGDQRVALLGYSMIDVSGGDGTFGGNGTGSNCCEFVTFEANSDYDNSTNRNTVGSVVNEVPIDVSGGDTTATATGTGTGAGGDGGQVSIYADADSDIAGGVSRVTNTADINLNGGVAFGLGESAGDGGEFYLGSYHGSDNSGAVTANGGSGGQYGGSGGSFYLESQIGVSNNTGAVAANGGEGTEDGGQGGDAEIYAYPAVNTAAMSVNGGNSTDLADVDSEGGNGGYIELGYGLAVDNSGSLSYTEGAGMTVGNEGCAIVGIINNGACNN